jgi:hypothetical protein
MRRNEKAVVAVVYVLSTRLLSPHRPFSRPHWLGVAQLHKSVRYPDESHWPKQPDWVNNPADLIISVTWAPWVELG